MQDTKKTRKATTIQFTFMMDILVGWLVDRTDD